MLFTQKIKVNGTHFIYKHVKTSHCYIVRFLLGHSLYKKINEKSKKTKTYSITWFDLGGVSWTEITWRIPSFSRSTTCLNLEFSFSYTGCPTKIKENRLTYYLLIAEVCIVEFILFLRVWGYMKCKLSRSGFELKSPFLFSNDHNHYTTSA